MRKSLPMLASVLAFGLGFAADSAAAYTVVLEKVQITSYSLGTGENDVTPAAGVYDLEIEGRFPARLKGDLIRDGRVLARDFPVRVEDCREGRQASPRGRFERPKRRGARTVRLVTTAEIELPGERGRRVCDLVADVPLTSNVQPQQGRPNPGGPGQGNSPAPQQPPGDVTAGEPPSDHDRPNPGGPGQGNFAAPALPNLRVRSAKAMGGRGATDLGAVVVNDGAGAAGKTKLRLIYIKDGVATTASALVPALAAGQKTLVQVGTGKPLAAADKITLRVDDPNKISETDETDNGYIYSP